MNQLTKICSKCRIEKPLQNFHKDITAVLGHKPSCKECTKKYSADYAIRKSEELKTRHKRVAAKRRLGLGLGSGPKVPTDAGGNYVDPYSHFGSEQSFYSL